MFTARHVSINRFPCLQPTSLLHLGIADPSRSRVPTSVHNKSHVMAQSHQLAFGIMYKHLYVHPAIENLLNLHPDPQPLDALGRQRLLEIKVQQQSRVPERACALLLEPLHKLREHICHESNR